MPRVWEIITGSAGRHQVLGPFSVFAVERKIPLYLSFCNEETTENRYRYTDNLIKQSMAKYLLHILYQTRQLSVTYHHNDTMDDKKNDTEDKNDEGEMVDLDNNDRYSRYSVIKIRSQNQKSCFEKTLAFLKKLYYLMLGLLQVTFILFFVLTYFKVVNCQAQVQSPSPSPKSQSQDWMTPKSHQPPTSP